MKIFNHFFLLLFMGMFVGAMAGCKKANKTTEKPVTVKSTWEVEVKKTYTTEEKVIIKFKNIAEKEIIVYDPLIVRVEQKVAGEETQWKVMRWLYCPCGASCPPPPNQLGITQGQVKTFVWNKEEKWCKGGMKTEKLKAPKGTYRLRMRYKNPKTNEREVYYQEFNIE